MRVILFNGKHAACIGVHQHGANQWPPLGIDAHRKLTGYLAFPALREVTLYYP
jgi:hypothetical protein